ncbi:MAG: ankyrin repeat domain-containing protein [Bacteroidia bacterium]|nr:MAG: ankyrin repeat domain-containing protein [Bacteroidia bacterium]
MCTSMKSLILYLLLLSMGASLNAQKKYYSADSLAVDSIVNRIRAVLNEYNETVIFVDTSDYQQYFPEAVDINLQIAASKGNCTEIIRLVARGADVNNFVGDNATPLHYAVAGGFKNAAEILLLLGASPDSLDIYSNTPLISAVKSDNLEMVELLIRYGANLSRADINGAAPLHHSAALGYFYLADMLLYYGAPAQISDKEGNTPLMISVWAGYYDITDVLLKAGADPNTSDKKGFTPLMMAAQNGDTLMLRLLLDSGADLYKVNHDGLDALCTAIRNGCNDAVVFLLENGHRWLLQPEGKFNPANIAVEYGHGDLLHLLKEYGIEAGGKFALDEIVFGTGGMITRHYSFISGSISLREPRLKAGITVGADFNPVRTRLILKETESLFYQYRLTTTVIHAGIFKEFKVHEGINDARLSIVTTLSAGYRFHSYYEGTRQKPEERFCIIPSLGIEWSRKHFGSRAGLSYLNTPFYQVSPLWFSLGCSFNLSRQIPRAPGKKIRIYNYE